MSLPADLAAALARLRAWLSRSALPIWWERGADAVSGGFFDRIALDGTPEPGPKRARVQARQAYVYATAAERGWMPAPVAHAAAQHALDALCAMRRSDGLYVAAGSRPGPFDGMGEVYDQAFALLAFASGHSLTGGYEQQADALRRTLGRYAQPLGGLSEALGLAQPLYANPSMHLFESAQAWRAIAADPAWGQLADSLSALAMERLTRERGLVLERYEADWRVPPATSDRVVWPGHLYEWAFLLLRHDPASQSHRRAALWLIDQAEAKGVDRARGVAIFALDGDLIPVDRGARLWAQTERLRAVATAAALTDDAGLWTAALQACGALETFLDVPTPGLWRDWMDSAGVFREEPAPASSFYHIVGAITELERLAAGGA